MIRLTVFGKIGRVHCIHVNHILAKMGLVYYQISIELNSGIEAENG
jgi:hypothetical protein